MMHATLAKKDSFTTIRHAILARKESISTKTPAIHAQLTNISTITLVITALRISLSTKMKRVKYVINVLRTYTNTTTPVINADSMSTNIMANASLVLKINSSILRDALTP